MAKPLEKFSELKPQADGTRIGLSVDSLKRAMIDNLFYIQGRFPVIATKNDYYMALAYTVRDRLLNRWINTTQKYIEKDTKIAVYLSAEYLMGPQLTKNLINLDIHEQVREALEECGLSLDELIELEPEPGLGNGGLGRLAACYLDSMATMEIPAIAYGIRYEFGIFNQVIHDGWQEEYSDKWLHLGNPWEIPKPDMTYDVKLGGYTECYYDNDGQYRVRWIPDRVVKGVACDIPILGYKVNTCNTLRLWSAEAPESFDFQAFNIGDYYRAVEKKVRSENITKVLYPNDETMQGKRLRLEQQYFFVSCSLQDLIRIQLFVENSLGNFYDNFALQLNDTHPSIGVPELMRLLVDEHHMSWDQAWDITQKAFAYTNHTLLPEALEKWSLELFGELLPRHLEIIYEINRRFLDEVRIRYPEDSERIQRLSLIEESGDKYVRMANVACVGSHAINGVAELHTKLLTECVLHDFYELWPQKFSNKTNGVTQRRWMVNSNPQLADLITHHIGDNWIKHLEDLRKLEPLALDTDFQTQWRRVKFENKRHLAKVIHDQGGVSVDPNSLFDIQVKRLHEYKRQHLNVLHIITLYNRLKHNPNLDIQPRTFIFAGKAAPAYFMAKLIIKLINSVADVVNRDPDVKDLLKVVFLPNYSVKNSQCVYPSADLSEQISTAGKEASGTGNMKFALNGALTIGTLDGANVEIREEVGEENFFLFGLTTEQVYELKSQGYSPAEFYHSNEQLRAAIDLIQSGFFSHGDRGLFKPLVESLLNYDEYMLLTDYQPYLDCQEQVSQAFQDQAHWTHMSILNSARMGKFSSDRAIREYCEDIWKVEPVSIELDDELSADRVCLAV